MDFDVQWFERPLGEVTWNHDGKRRPVKESERKKGPYPYYGASGIVDYVDGYLFEGRHLLIAEDGENLRTRQTPIAFMADGKFWVNNHAHIVTGNGEVTTEYLNYFLQNADIQSYLTGAVMPKLTQGNLNRIPVRYPTPDYQKSIVRVLGSLDAKIDLNRRINQTLEVIAQATFKSWFVDFDPVKAKIAAIQEGRDRLRAAMSAISGKPDAELDGLPREQYDQLAATAALFPEEMDESELDEIPRGWMVKSIADVARFASGKVEVSSLSEDNYISTENMLENRAGVARATSLPSAATVPSFTTGQVLISNIRPYFKKIWMARFDGGRSPDVLAFAPADSQWPEFLYSLMYQDSFFEFMTRTAKGAKMPRGDKDAIVGWKFPCPSGVLMTHFSAIVRPHYVHIANLTSENKALAELREALLPKLLSGELSVFEDGAEAEA